MPQRDTRSPVRVTVDGDTPRAFEANANEVRFSFDDVVWFVTNEQLRAAADPGQSLAHVRDSVGAEVVRHIDAAFDELFERRGEPHHTCDGERLAERRRRMDSRFSDFFPPGPARAPGPEAAPAGGESPLAALDRLVDEVTGLARA